MQSHKHTKHKTRHTLAQRALSLVLVVTLLSKSMRITFLWRFCRFVISWRSLSTDGLLFWPSSNNNNYEMLLDFFCIHSRFVLEKAKKKSRVILIETPLNPGVTWNDPYKRNRNGKGAWSDMAKITQNEMKWKCNALYKSITAYH